MQWPARFRSGHSEYRPAHANVLWGHVATWCHDPEGLHEADIQKQMCHLEMRTTSWFFQWLATLSANPSRSSQTLTAHLYVRTVHGMMKDRLPIHIEECLLSAAENPVTLPNAR